MDELISRQDAIEAVMDEFKRIPTNAIRAKTVIEQLPSAQPPTDSWCHDCSEYDHDNHCCLRWNRVIRNALKDAQPERKTGRWERTSFYDSTPICSECGIEGRWDFEYCPYCGCKMEVEHE